MENIRVVQNYLWGFEALKEKTMTNTEKRIFKKIQKQIKFHCQPVAGWQLGKTKWNLKANKKRFTT